MTPTAARDSRVIRRQEVGGVPVYWSDVPGVARAVLAFRTGRADEALVTNGVTHLVEHLALRGLGSPSYQFNGATGALTTCFLIVGSPGEVVEFMGAVSAALALLPRCPDEERAVLEVEESKRPYTAVDHIMRLRFGATGWGLGAYREFALRRATDAELRTWASARFGKQNAVAFMSCPPPDRLSFPLLAGPRQPLPPHSDRLADRLPAFARWQGTSVVASWTASDTPSSRLTTAIARDRAQSTLRQCGLSYGVAAQSTVLDASTVIVTLIADGKPADADTILAHVRTALDSLASDGPTAQELERQQVFVRNSVMSDESIHHDLMACGMHELLGTGYHLGTAAVTAFDGVTARDVAAEAATARATPIFLLPQSAHGAADLALLEHRPAPCVEGKKLKPLVRTRENGHHRLVFGETGVSALTKRDCITVPFDGLAAAVIEANGVWTLIGDSGDTIRIDQTRWLNAAGQIKRLDRLIPASKRVVTEGAGDDGNGRPGPRRWRRRAPLGIAAAFLLAGSVIAGHFGTQPASGCTPCSPSTAVAQRAVGAHDGSPSGAAAAPSTVVATARTATLVGPNCGGAAPTPIPALLDVTYQLGVPSDPVPCIRAAGLTLRAPPSTQSHAHLDLYLQGGQVTIPAGIGMTPTRDQRTALSTSTSNGVIDIAAGSRATLGQFFTEWGHPLGNRTIGSLQELDGRRTQWFVNGSKVDNPAAVVVQDHDEIFAFEDLEGAVVKPVTSYAWTDRPG